MSPGEVSAVAEHGAASSAVMNELLQQINKGSSIEGSVDWSRVEQLATELLDNGIKHFQVVCYWGVARLHHQGFPAIAETAERLAHLVVQHWDNALPHPKRLRGRVNALAWWLERTVSWIKRQVTDPLDPELQLRTVASVEYFDKALAERCDTDLDICYLLNTLKQLAVVLPLRQASQVTSPPMATAADDLPHMTAGDAPISTGGCELDGQVGDVSKGVSSVQETDTETTSCESCLLVADSAPESASDPDQESCSESRVDRQAAVVCAPISAQQRVDQAETQVRLGNLTQAIRSLQQGQKELMGADRLQLTRALARLLHQAGYAELAAMQIRQALALVKQHQLASWDPILAQQALEDAYDFFMATDDTQAASDVLEPLSLLDTAQVVKKLSGSLN